MTTYHGRGVAAFGSAAARWATRLPASLPVIVTDVSGLDDAFAEGMARRRAGSPFLVCPIVPDERTLAVRRLAELITRSTADRDEWRRFMNLFVPGDTNVANRAQATYGQVELPRVRIVRDLIVLADGVLVRSYREHHRIEAMLVDRLRNLIPPMRMANVARYAPPASDVPPVAARAGAREIVVWAPAASAQYCLTFALALDELRTPVTIVCSSGAAPVAGLRARFASPESAADALAAARLVITIDEEPGAALAFAALGYAVAAPSTAGADEWLARVVSYYPWDVHSILAAAADGLGSPPALARGDSRDEAEIAAALRASAVPERADPPLVSLIVPTYNRRQYVPLVLRAIAAQDYPHLEVVVVNDGESIADLCAPYPNVRLIEPGPRGGLNAAYNAGIRAARGTYIGIQPDDDPPFPDFVSRLVDALENASAGIAHAIPVMSIVERNAAGGYDLLGYHLAFDGVLDRPRLLAGNTIANTILFRRELLERQGFYDEAFGPISDYALWLAISDQVDFVHVPRVVCELIMRRDGTNASFADREKLPDYYAAVYARHPVADRPQLDAARAANLRAIMTNGPSEIVVRVAPGTLPNLVPAPETLTAP